MFNYSTFQNGIYFGVVNILPTYCSFDQRIWFTVISFFSNRTVFCSKYKFPLLKLSYILSQSLLSWTELPKCTPTVFMENCNQVFCLDLSILFSYAPVQKIWMTFEMFIFEEAFSHYFKINYFLVRQLKSLKKMEVSSAKFTILISWSPICMSLILVSASMKTESTSATMMHGNIESRQP